MITAKDDSYEEEISYVLAGMIETMINNYTLNDEEKKHFFKELQGCKTQIQGMNLAAKLTAFEPIMGLHSWPHGQNEDLGKAIQYQVDKDNFHESRWKK